jgi:hypothetical protein
MADLDTEVRTTTGIPAEYTQSLQMTPSTCVHFTELISVTFYVHTALKPRMSSVFMRAFTKGTEQMLFRQATIILPVFLTPSVSSFTFLPHILNYIKI